MRLIQIICRTRLLGTLLVLLLGVWLLAQTPLATYAVVRGCRADPIITLSNGDKLNLIATVSTEVSNIRTITYTVHAPVGTTISSIVYTGGPNAPKEIVLFYADVSSYNYSTSTYVDAKKTDIPVTAKTMRTTQRDGMTYSGSVSGTTQQELVLNF